MIHEVVRPKNPYTIKIPPAHRRLFATGIGLALASPSAIFWFAAIGGSIAASFGGERKALLGFTAGFFTAGITWSAVFAWASEGLIRLTGGRLVQIMALVSAVMFLYFAVVVFLQGFHQFALVAQALAPAAPRLITAPGAEQTCL
jgi:L-lysine exporter family protein LysE/ArgO